MRKLVLALAITASAVSSHAQTSPSSEAAMKQIWTLGMDSSQVMRIGQTLMDSLGPRLLGSPDMAAAQNWAVQMLGGWGAQAKVENFGTWRGWRRGYSHIDLVEPRTRTLEGTMLGFSPGTKKKNKTSETTILPMFKDSAEFAQWLPNAKGKLVLVSAPVPSCRPVADMLRLTTPAAFKRDSAQRAQNARDWNARNVRGSGLALALGGGELAVRLEAAGAAGVISSRPTDSYGTYSIFETYTTKVPTVTLACEDYGLVYRLTENNQHPKIRLNLDAQLLGKQPVGNVIGRIPGTTKPDEYVVLSAHFDSWDGASGATDNGTGSSMMLEAMRILSKVLPKPQRTILIGLWAGEEEGLVGSGAFAEDHPEVLKGLQGVFNQDNGTGRVMRVGAGGMVNGAVHLGSWIKQLPAEVQAQLPYDGSPGRPSGGGTDDASFACHGVPAFGMGSAGMDYFNYTWHTNRDTFDKVIPEDLKYNATLVAMLAYLASEDPAFITRERVDLNALPANPPPGVPARAGGPPQARTWPTCTPVPRATKPRLK